MTHVDVAGLEALRDLTGSLARDGITLRVARMKSPVQRRLDGAGVAHDIGPEHFHPTFRAAVDAPCNDPAGVPQGARRLAARHDPVKPPRQ